MSLETDGTVARLLLVATDDQDREHLRAALSSDYEVSTLSMVEKTFSMPATAASFDIILIVRDTMDRAYLDSLKSALEVTPCAVAVFVQQDPDRLAATAIRFGITSYVVDGYVLSRVPTVIELSLERFKLQQALHDELQKSQEELAARKIIERAKGLLMDKKDLNEQDAYRSLRELAMRQSKSIKEVSETLILYSDILP